MSLRCGVFFFIFGRSSLWLMSLLFSSGLRWVDLKKSEQIANQQYGQHFQTASASASPNVYSNRGGSSRPEKETMSATDNENSSSHLHSAMTDEGEYYGTRMNTCEIAWIIEVIQWQPSNHGPWQSCQRGVATTTK